MKLLAIETSTETCSVALSLDGERRERFEHAPRGHARLLLPWVESLLAEAGLRLPQLDAVAFSRGPGSFTALRIGIGVTQGLAWGADLPVVPVSSLQATAQGVDRDGVLVAMDARMNEVFAGAFRRQDHIMRPAGEEAVLLPEAVTVPPEGAWCGAGNGFDRFEPLRALAARLEGVIIDAWPRAAAVAELAEDWLRDHEPLPPEQAQPVYLRDRVAEKPSA